MLTNHNLENQWFNQPLTLFPMTSGKDVVRWPWVNMTHSSLLVYFSIFFFQIHTKYSSLAKMKYVNSNLWLLKSNMFFCLDIEPDLDQYWAKAYFQAIFLKLAPDIALWPIWMKINSYLFFWPQIYCFGSILDLIWSNNELWVILTHVHVITSFWFT